MGNLICSMTYGNTLTEPNTYSLDQELTRGLVLDGAIAVLDRTIARADNLNSTAITDGITPTRNVARTHDAANRLTNGQRRGEGATGTVRGYIYLYEIAIWPHYL
jgi:hypothetical protein